MLATQLNNTIAHVLNHYNDNHKKAVRGIKTAAFRKWLASLTSTEQKIAEMYLDGVIMMSHSNKVAERKLHTGAKHMKTALTKMEDAELIAFIDRSYIEHLEFYA